MSPKRKARQEQFRKLGAALTRIGDPNVPDYHTGQESRFYLAYGETPAWNAIPFGPTFKTPQYKRAVKQTHG